MLAAPVFVQQATGTGTKKTNVVTITPTSAPDHVEILAISHPTSLLATSVVQTNVTWTLAVSDTTNTTCEVYIGSPINANPGSTVTTTYSTNQNSVANVSEWSGLTSKTDGTNHNSGTGATVTSGSITTTNANDLSFAMTGYPSSNSVVTQPTGYTSLTAASISAAAEVQPNYKILSATSTENPQWTIVSATWCAAIAALQGTPAINSIVFLRQAVMRAATWTFANPIAILRLRNRWGLVRNLIRLRVIRLRDERELGKQVLAKILEAEENFAQAMIRERVLLKTV